MTSSLRVPGEPQRAGPADGADQGHVCQEAGDDEEDVHHNGPGRVATAGLDKDKILYSSTFHKMAILNFLNFPHSSCSLLVK